MMVVVMICADILICIQSCIHLLSLTAVKDCIAAHKFQLPRSSQFHLQARHQLHSDYWLFDHVDFDYVISASFWQRTGTSLQLRRK